MLVLGASAASAPITVQADPDTGALLRPSAALFVSGNGLTSASTVNGYFADPSTNPSWNAAAWWNDLAAGGSGVPLLASGVVTLTSTSGTGNFARVTSPTFVTPTLGAATATSINGLTLTASTGTLAITNAKTFSVSDTITLASDGTGTRTLNVGTGGTLGSAAYTAASAYVPAWSGLTTNGLLQATSATAVQSTLTPNGLTSLGVNSITSAALSAFTLGTGTSGTFMSAASATNRVTFTTDVLRLTGGTVSVDLQTDLSTVGYVGTSSNHPLAFLANNAEKGRVTTTGNLLFGTTTDLTSVTGGIKSVATGAGATATNSSTGQFQLSSAAGTIGMGGGVIYTSGNINSAGNIIATGSGGVGTNFYVGGTGSGAAGINNTYFPSGGTGVTGNQTYIIIPATGTSSTTGFDSRMETAAAAFTVSGVVGFQARDNGLGAGSSVTTQTGVNVTALSLGSTIYGIRSQIASGTNKWNIYADGTAPNLFAGVTSVTNTTEATPGAGSVATAGGIYAAKKVITASTFENTTGQINYPLSVYATGTVYTLTASDALVDFGTTDPSLVLDKAGTYLLMGRAYVAYNGATYVANQTVTAHLRRTNNTAADVSNATTTAQMRVITTITDSVGVMQMPAVIYSTANTNDSISVYGSVSATPAAGSVTVNEASIVAIRLY